MLALSIDRIGDLAILECEGGINWSEGFCKLRDAVISLQGAQIIVLDLSEISTIDRSGLSVLLVLQRWAYGQRIQLKLFNPRWCVREKLEGASAIPGFDIASLDEMTAILANAEHRLTMAA